MNFVVSLVCLPSHYDAQDRTFHYKAVKNKMLSATPLGTYLCLQHALRMATLLWKFYNENRL